MPPTPAHLPYVPTSAVATPPHRYTDFARFAKRAISSTPVGDLQPASTRASSPDPINAFPRRSTRPHSSLRGVDIGSVDAVKTLTVTDKRSRTDLKLAEGAKDGGARNEKDKEVEGGSKALKKKWEIKEDFRNDESVGSREKMASKVFERERTSAKGQKTMKDTGRGPFKEKIKTGSTTTRSETIQDLNSDGIKNAKTRRQDVGLKGGAIRGGGRRNGEVADGRSTRSAARLIPNQHSPLH